MIYKCECCNFETNAKNNYKNHLKTEKHKQKSNEYPMYPFTGYMDTLNSDIEEKSEQVIENKKYICEKCGNRYTYHSGLAKHVKKCGTFNTNESIEIMKLKHEMEKKRTRI
jgi:hypothetical protein